MKPAKKKSKHANIKSVIVTQFERSDGGHDCVKGIFERDKYFRFQVFLDDVESKETYSGTRFSEFYIHTEDDDFPQYSWGPINPPPLDWPFGEKLVRDLVHGLEVAMRTMTADNAAYAEKVVQTAAQRLQKAGINDDLARVVFAQVMDRIGSQASEPARKLRKRR